MKPKEPKGRALENLAYVTQIGISMLVPIMLGLYIGKWIDKKLGTGPIFLFAFILMGIVSSFINLFKMTEKQTGGKRRK